MILADVAGRRGVKCVAPFFVGGGEFFKVRERKRYVYFYIII